MREIAGTVEQFANITWPANANMTLAWVLWLFLAAPLEFRRTSSLSICLYWALKFKATTSISSQIWRFAIWAIAYLCFINVPCTCTTGLGTFLWMWQAAVGKLSYRSLLVSVWHGLCHLLLSIAMLLSFSEKITGLKENVQSFSFVRQLTSQWFITLSRLCLLHMLYITRTATTHFTFHTLLSSFLPTFFASFTLRLCTATSVSIVFCRNIWIPWLHVWTKRRLKWKMSAAFW